MSRICVIGDSHVAALRQAIKTDPAIAGGHEITFFASIGATLRGALQADNRTLTTQDPRVAKSFRMTAGDEVIRLDRYDAFAIVGFRTGLGSAVELAGRMSPLSLGIAGATPVSGSLFRTLLEQALRRTIASEIAKLLAGVVRVPIAVLPNANNSEGILDHETGDASRRLLAAATGKTLSGLHQAALAAAFGPEMAIVGQPEDTVVRDFLTARTFSEGSVRLARNDVEHPDDDFGHMNAVYGGKTLRALIKSLEPRITR